MKSDPIRCFVAIEIPDRIQETISDVQSDVRTKIKRVSWTRKGNYHITLKFLGDITRSKIDDIDRILANVALAQQPFSIEIGGIGAFPSMNRPRVLWIGLTQGAQATEHLAKLINRELKKTGFPNDRRFHPHLTLARLRDRVNLESYSSLFDRFEKITGLSVAVNHITLIRSELRPSGAVYTPIDIYPLGREKANNGE